MNQDELEETIKLITACVLIVIAAVWWFFCYD